MLSAWSRQHTLMRRIISIAALFLFINCFIFPDAEAAVDTSASPYELSEVSSAYARSDPETFTVPAHLGEVKYFHRGDTDKIVMHIQDAHCNRFAQHKISDIIDYLNREYGVSMVNLEGGSGDYDLSVFTSITGEAIRMEVADYFVKTGDVNGAEFYAINNPGKVKLWGIEDKDLYLANLKIYQDSLGYKQDVDKHLNELTYILNNLKRHIYTPALLKTDMAYNAYKAEKMEFREYLEFLIEKAGKNAIEVRRYKNLYLLGKAMELEDTIDFRKANTERSTLVDELKKSLSRNETRELVTRSVDFKAKKISQKAFYNYLLGKVKETTMDVGRFPAFSNYVIYVGIYEAVDRVKVMVELDELEAEIKEPLYGNDTQRRLNTLSRNLALTKNLFAITLTRTDYQYYRENEDLFVVRDYLKFIAEEAPRYKIGARPGADITKLDSYRENIVKFYEYSFKRDEVFLKNMRFSAVPGGSRSAVLMTGGFHTDNLCGLFEKEGISYVSIIPKFTSEKGYECPYFDLLAGETADIQQMLRSALARGATLQIASKLSALGKDVWDREEVDAFHDAVIMLRMIGEQKGSDAIRKGVKNIVLSENREDLIVSLQDDSEIHINLSEFKATVRSVTLQEAVDEGYDPEKLINQAVSIATHNREADSEKYALHKATKVLEGGKTIVVVTAETSALRDLNEKWGHTDFDLVRDAFGDASGKYLIGNKEELTKMGVTLVGYYQPYGGRWQYAFEVDNAVYNEKKGTFEDFLDGMLESSIEFAQNYGKESKLSDTEAFNVIMGVSDPREGELTSLQAVEIEKLRDVLFEVKRELKGKPDIIAEVESWIALTEKSPPAEIGDIASRVAGFDMANLKVFGEYCSDHLGISPKAENFAKEFVKAIKRRASGAYYLELIENIISDSDSLIVYAENKYYADPALGNFKYWAGRSVREKDELNIFKSPSAGKPRKRVFFHDQDAADKWIESNKGDVRYFKGQRLPKHIPDFERVEQEKGLLVERIKKETIERGKITDDLKKEVDSFIARTVRLSFVSEFGLLQGSSVINTLMRKFLNIAEAKKKGTIFRVNIDFDYLSKFLKAQGDAIKARGMLIVQREFEDAFGDKTGVVATAQKGAGDEMVVVGYLDGGEVVLKKAIETVVEGINGQLKKLKFGEPGEEPEFITTEVTHEFIDEKGKGKIEESKKWAPSVSAGYAGFEVEGVDVRDLLKMEKLLDPNAEKANDEAKKKGKERVKFHESVGAGEVDTIRGAEIEPVISSELFERLGLEVPELSGILDKIERLKRGDKLTEGAVPEDISEEGEARADAAFVDVDVSAESLLFGLQDPTGNAALTDKIGEMSDGLKPGGVNIIVDESYDDLTASVRRKWAQKTGRKFRKKWGVNVEYRPEKLSDEKSIGNILNRIREDLKDEEKYPAPMVLFKCVRAETVTRLKKLLDEEYMELKNVVSIVDLSKAGVKADEHHDNIVRLIHYANQVLNWERLGAYFKTGEKERMRLGKEMISRLRQAKYFDENQFYRKFGKEGVKNASNEEFFKFMEDLKTGEILVTITKIDWKEIQEYNDAMEAVYRSL